MRGRSIHLHPFFVLLAALIVLAAVAADQVSAQARCAVKIGGTALSADLEAGRKAFLKCRACHTLKAGEQNLVGPNLWQVLKRPPAGAEGFSYSSAFQTLKPKWDIPTLDAFIEKPSKAVPGTKMIFAGIAAPQERANLAAWLARESGTPLPGC